MGNTHPNSRNEQPPPDFRKVLVVDDNPAVVAAVATRLMSVGWECLTALDGHDAMQLMSTCPPDALVTDIDMPYVDGFGLIELALSFQHCPVLAITGSEESAQRCRRDYPHVPLLNKPFTVAQVLAFLGTLDETESESHHAA